MKYSGGEVYIECTSHVTTTSNGYNTTVQPEGGAPGSESYNLK